MEIQISENTILHIDKNSVCIDKESEIITIYLKEMDSIVEAYLSTKHEDFIQNTTINALRANYNERIRMLKEEIQALKNI